MILVLDLDTIRYLGPTRLIRHVSTVAPCSLLLAPCKTLPFPASPFSMFFIDAELFRVGSVKIEKDEQNTDVLMRNHHVRTRS